MCEREVCVAEGKKEASVAREAAEKSGQTAYRGFAKRMMLTTTMTSRWTGEEEEGGEACDRRHDVE